MRSLRLPNLTKNKLMLSASGQHQSLERPLSKSGWCGKRFDGGLQCKDSLTATVGCSTNRCTLRWETQCLQTSELMEGLRGKGESLVHNPQSEITGLCSPNSRSALLQDVARCHAARALRPLTVKTNRPLQVLRLVTVETLTITYSIRVTSGDRRRAPLHYAHYYHPIVQLLVPGFYCEA